MGRRRGTVPSLGVGLLLLIGATSACEQVQREHSLVETRDDDPPRWWQRPDDGATDSDPALTVTEEPVVGPEQCDGFDNDRDGQIDEQLPTPACRVGDEAGVTTCVNGREVCRQCEPGDTREVPCECSIMRHDRCNDAGRWLLGACSGCEEQAPVGCAAAGACEPGERRTQRCDLCTEGAACGANCIGSEQVCDEDCTWREVGACEPRPAECDGDLIYFEPCGKCGQRKVTCDGCFSELGVCEDEGICTPGEEFSAPCAGDSCAPGNYATIRCNNQCEWEQSECAGCDVTKPPVFSWQDCVPGASCGYLVVRERCVAGGTALSCAGEVLPQGELESTVIRNDCVDLTCLPGQTRSTPCTTDLGECGSRTDACDLTCEWPSTPSGECVALPGSCVPGTETTEALSCGEGTCGATYTRTSTCRANGCGWSAVDSGACPACSQGQTSSSGCTTSEGRCGSQVRACTAACEWGTWEGCVAAAHSCVPGEQTNTPISCGAGTCGATYTMTSTCTAGGCGWSNSFSGSCPVCSQGQQDTQSCTTPDGRCGTQSRSCTGACEWGGWSECTPRADSCVPGSVIETPISCGAGLCGATQTQTSTCLTNGCGWSTAVTGSCPSCSSGETETRSCTTSAGECGTSSRACSGTCDWGSWSTCAPRPDACTPGAEQSRDCTWMCGLPGSRTWECNGCGWDPVGECLPDDSSACSPGDFEDLGPCPLCPTQNRTRQCDASCQWVTSTCRVCL